MVSENITLYHGPFVTLLSDIYNRQLLMVVQYVIQGASCDIITRSSIIGYWGYFLLLVLQGGSLSPLGISLFFPPLFFLLGIFPWNK